MRSIYRQWEEDGELDNILLLVRKWRGDGAELDWIAEKLGISRATLFEYQKKHQDFADALKNGKEVTLAKVEESLIKECVGYEYEETTTISTAIIDKKTGKVTNLEKVERRTTKKYARPSVSAIACFLNNKDPENWKNRITMESDVDQDVIREVERIVNGDGKRASS